MSQNVLRRAGKAGAVVAGGVMALAAVGAGTAMASEPTAPATTNAGITPIDGFAAHWVEYHYGTDFLNKEPKAITASPAKYAAIHQHMAEQMLGLAPLPADPDPVAGGTGGAAPMGGGATGYGY
jgi:hypothetical protein